MDKIFRHIERIVYKIFLFGIAFIGLLIISGYWLFKTDSGQVYLTQKAIQNANTKLSYQINFESVSSNGGRVTIKDLHLDNLEQERLISLDSLRTGVLLSSIFKNSVTIPELTVYGLRVEKTIDQKLLDSFSSAKHEDSSKVEAPGLLNRYLSRLSWTFSQLSLKLDSLDIDLDQKQLFLDQIYLDFDFVQLSTSDFYAVMDTLKIDAVLDNEKHAIKAQGILYRDLRDFAFSNMKVNLDEHYFHFNLEAIDVFSEVQKGLRQARFIDFHVFNDSYLSTSALSKQHAFFEELDLVNLGFSLKFLPNDGILEVSDITLSEKLFSFDGSLNVNLPEFALSNYNWNTISGDLNGLISIEPTFIEFLPENFTVNKNYFSEASTIKLKSSYYANVLDQSAEIFLQKDTLQLNHKVAVPSQKTGYLKHNVQLSSKNVSIGSILGGDASLTIAKPRLSAEISLNNNQINNLTLALDFDELKKYRMQQTSLTVEGTMEKPVFFLRTKMKDGDITSYGELSIDTVVTFASVKTTLNTISLNTITGSDRFSKSLLSGNIDILFNAKSTTPFNLKSTIKKSLGNQSFSQSHQLFLDVAKSDTTSYLLTFNAPFLNLELSANNVSELFKRAKGLGKATFVNLIDYTKSGEQLIQENLDTLPSFNLSTRAHVLPSNLLAYYFSEPLPTFIDAELQGNIALTKNSLKSTFSINSDSLSFNTVHWKDFSGWLSFDIQDGAFNIDSTSHRKIDFTLDVARIDASKVPVSGISYKASLDQNSITFSQKTDNFIQNARFDYTIDGEIADQGLLLNLKDFLFGNEIYGWRTTDTAQILWDDFKHADIKNVSLTNGNERIEIDGSIGNSITDLVNYRLVNLDLGKLSTLLQSRMPFAGLVNGSFTLGSNSQTPFFEGKLAVDALSLRSRTIGDLTIKSSLDSLSGLFLANLAIKTDSVLYPGVPNQNIYGSGYFNPKGNANESDTLAYLAVEFEDLSLWFLPSVATNVFDSTSGRATGYGSFVATKDDFDYDAFFSVDSVYAKPKFINTDFYLSGPIYFTRSAGVIIDTVIVEDQYGDAKFWGNVDLNDFEEEKFMNLSMRMNNLQFMNNLYDPDVPFYGNVQGTGTVTLKGSSLSPTIATPDPIRISPGSELKLPLLDETDFEAERNYIRFTEDFSRPGLSAQEVLNRDKKVEEKVATIFSRDRNEVDRKFIDFFNLELLFSAPEETTIELIFDDVTNEILRANGSGDIRVGLSDKELLINGTYTLSSGSYNFVSADFFNRRFTLQNGGTIRWDGDPTNAQIDVSAVYTQRADFSSFLGQAASNDNATTLRYPIDMVLDITGRLQSIENDYRFRLGQNMEFATNLDIINNVIASVNTEQYKLYQATSFLLTNSFLPVENGASGGLADANRSVITNIQQNPDALIAPLLSGQINNLLNTNLGTVFQNLEIDLNLSTLDQIDLGLALRLFQDRLTIRRNRSVASAPNVNTIGDIDANYKLNNSWSLLLFHRQDPLFSDVSGVNNQQATNSQALNGVGLEWQQRFNSWQDLTQSLRKAWRRLFRLKEPALKEDEQSEQTITQKN